jgi:hypothetical protein
MQPHLAVQHQVETMEQRNTSGITVNAQQEL